MHTLDEVIVLVSELGHKKVNKTFREKSILGFIAGALVALAYLAYIKLYANLGSGWGSFLGALVFPVGLFVILLLGGELISGNMMVVGTSYINKKISFKDLIINWIHISLSNLVGAVFVALVFGKLSGVLDPNMDLVNTLALGKLNGTFMQLVISGMGCNWFVGLAVMMCVGAKEGFLKFMGLWIPTAVFVMIGFQHCVANMFLVALGAMNNVLSWGQFFGNISTVFIGNAIGGVVLVGLLYSMSTSKSI